MSTGLRDSGLLNLAEGEIDDITARYRNNRECLLAFLGGRSVVDFPVNAARYYCGLMAHCVEAVCRRGRWRRTALLGNSATNPEHSSYVIAPGQKREYLSDGTLLLERANGRRLAVTLCLSARFGAAAVISAAANDKRLAQGFAARLKEALLAKNIYKGRCLLLPGPANPIEVLERPTIAWDDLIMADELKQDILANTTHFLRRLDTLREFGVSGRRGCLLVGGPGLAKTSAVLALANSAPDVSFIFAQTSCLGISAYVADVYAIARDLRPAVCVLDDLDVLIQSRDAFFPNSDALAQFLQTLGGQENLDGVVSLAIVNDVGGLDKALLRPSRFDVQLVFEPPDSEQRRAFLQVMRRRMIPFPDESVELFVTASEGCTLCQLQEAVWQCLIGSDDVTPSTAGTAFSSETIARVFDRLQRKKRLGFPPQLSSSRRGTVDAKY